MRGTFWIFIGISTLIEYLARLEKGGSLGNKRTKKMPPPPDSMEEYASFIRRRFPKRKKYKSFEYVLSSPTPGANLRNTGKPIPLTRKDLPEQMYYVMRCGLVHSFSLAVSSRERKNGARPRSITINSRLDAKAAGMRHLDNFSRPPEVTDAAYFVDEDLLDDLITAIKNLFRDNSPSVKKNISKLLRDEPFIWPY